MNIVEIILSALPALKDAFVDIVITATPLFGKVAFPFFILISFFFLMMMMEEADNDN